MISQIDPNQLLNYKSRVIKDPAGRDVRVLKDEDAFKIAHEYNCRIQDVYLKALNQRIYPYRYLRNREIISIQEQIKLAKSRVAVIGAGGLGGHIILLLTRLGIGHLVVVDHDVFEESNLNRQALCNEKSLGKSKSEEAVAAVGSINPAVRVTSYQVRINASNAEDILAGSGVIVDALDNITDRFLIEKLAKKLRIPLVHGALAGFEGQLMTIFPDDPGLKQIYGKVVKDKNSKGAESVLGVPVIMPSLISTLQAMEVLKIILNRGRLFRNAMVFVDMETGQLNEYKFGNSPPKLH